MENELSRTVDALPALVWTASPDGRAEFVNRRWCEYSGLSVEQASGEGWQATIHSDDLPALLQIWRTTVATGKPNEAEARMRRFDGKYRWHLCRASPITDVDGKVIKWCGINTDIEDRKRAQAALREQEERFRVIVEGLPVRVILFTPEGELLHANRHTLEYSGATIDELKQWVGKDFTHPDDRPETVTRFYASIRTGEPYDFESRHRRADGIYQWFRVQGFPLRDQEGRIVLWYFLQTDIDDRKHAEALLSGEKRLLEMVAMGLPLPTVLESLCRLAEEIAGDCICGVSLIATDDMTFQWVGTPSLPPSYTYPSQGSSVHAEEGPCGTAASVKDQILVEDIASESRWPQAWQELSLAHGLRSCWSTPIVSCAHEVQGALTIYRTVPGKPTPLHRELIGQLVRIAGIAIRHARSDMAVKRSEESFRAIVETTPEFVKLIGRDGTLLQANSVGADIGGVPSANALVGTCFYDLVVPEHRAMYVAFNEDICSGNKGRLEFDIISLHGERRHLETHAAPMRTSDGSVVQLAVTRDITTHKHADEQLRKSAALMAKMEQLTLTGSFCWRPASGEFTWSEQLYRIFGFEPGMPITMDKLAERLHPGDHHLLHDMIEHAQEGKDLEYDHRLLLPDGSVKYVSLRAHATRAQDRLEYIGAIQDVSERRRSEAALSTLQAELAHVSRVSSLGTLTASIAHEISQPLAGILTNAGTGLRMLSADPPNIQGALATVQRTMRDAGRASEVMTRLRAMFQKRALTTEAVDLVEASREVIELLRSEIRKRRIVLRLQIADELPPITGDRVQLQQVVLNLLLNAIEAMDCIDSRPRQMLVKIELDDEGCARFAVTDSGVGLAPEHENRLFDAFYTTKGEGMGIGLAVSRCIVNHHGGRLWATPNQDFGATFSFSIPCSPETGTSRPFASVRSAGNGEEQASRSL